MRLKKSLFLFGLIFAWSCGKGTPPSPSSPTCMDEEVICNKQNYVFVDINGSDMNNGSPNAPLQTIKRALEMAKERKSSSLVVGVGLYKENVMLVDGIGIKGGFDPKNGWKTSTDGITDIQNTTMESYGNQVGHLISFGIRGQDIQTQTLLYRLSIHAIKNEAVGESTYGLHCVNCPGLILEDVVLVAGSGGDANRQFDAAFNGEDGKNGQNGESSDCNAGNPPNGGYGGIGSAPIRNSGGNGGAGGSSSLPRNGQNGTPGEPSMTALAGLGGAEGLPGQNGQNGQNGIDGMHGKGGEKIAIQDHLFISEDGQSGTAGAPGEGGGGAGGGGGGKFTVSSYRGNGGGGGGSGGLPGKGGVRAYAGGSSIALFLSGSSGALLKGNNFFSSSDGSNGGIGQSGGSKGLGGKGGLGGKISHCGIASIGAGGNGGDGGDGGGGGSGGSGMGGSSIGIVLHNTELNPGERVQDHVQFSLGQPGKGGMPAGSVLGTPANAGNNGVAAEMILFWD